MLAIFTNMHHIPVCKFGNLRFARANENSAPILRQISQFSIYEPSFVDVSENLFAKLAYGLVLGFILFAGNLAIHNSGLQNQTLADLPASRMKFNVSYTHNFREKIMDKDLTYYRKL